MSYPQRFVSPIFVDLSLSPDMAAIAPVALDINGEEDPIGLDLLQDEADTLLKCELDAVFDVSQHVHGEPSVAFQFPVTAQVSSSVNITTNTSPSVVNASGHRGGRTSQFTAKQRRERHNANERRRTNAAKDRVRIMRDTVTALEEQRDALTPLAHAVRPVLEVVQPPSDVGSELRVPLDATYVDLVAAGDALRDEKRYLEDQLDVLDSQNSVLQAIQSELGVASSFVSAGKRKRTSSSDSPLKLQRSESAGCVTPGDREDEVEDETVEQAAGGYCPETEAVPSYLRSLFPAPLAADAAFDWVKDSYADIMAAKDSADESSAEQFLGWQAHHCKDVSEDGKVEYLLSQTLKGATSSQLVFATWPLLSTLDGLRQLFPTAKDAAVLQVLNDDCVVVRVGVTQSDGQDVHSLAVLARGQIDGGYLVSMRSVPLSAGQRAFAKSEGRYLQVLGWFMFLDEVDETTGQSQCEVTVGGRMELLGDFQDVRAAAQTVQHDLVAGSVRWQEAAGFGSPRLF